VKDFKKLPSAEDANGGPVRALVHVPAMAAIGLAVLYAVGAIAKVSQIAGAGFSPSVVVQDAPIQQLLSLGVSVAAEPASLAGIVALAAVIAAGAWMIDRADRAERGHTSMTASEVAVSYRVFQTREAYRRAVEGPSSAPPRPRPVSRIARRAWSGIRMVLLVVATLVWIFISIVFISWAAPTTFFSFVILLPSVWLIDRRLKVNTRTLVVFAFTLTTVVGMTARAVVYPLPLPHAELRTNHGLVEGQLLEATDASTTIGLANCHIETVPTADIRSLVIETQVREPIKRIGEILFGARSVRKSFRLSGPCGGLDSHSRQSHDAR
jgi:hypothetical protein